MPRKKLAFVVPWYGVSVIGGAETMARRIAENLALRGADVEVLTTCAADSGSSHDLSFFQKGESVTNGVLVRRFEADAPDSAVVDEITRKLKRGWHVTVDDERRFLNSLLRSPALVQYVLEHSSDYWYIYTPYWCGTTYWGALARPEASFIIPCLHDEPTAHMEAYRSLFQNVRGLMFYSQPEMALAQRLYQIESDRCTLIGGAIELDAPADAERFRKSYNIREEFILSVGRKAENKNTPLLINYFAEYKRRKPGNLKLVLVGPGKVDIPEATRGDILDLGILPESDKHDACSAAAVLCQPSVNESFSISIMEAWSHGTPVMVHADCQVTRAHCIESNGGLFFGDYAEFEGCVDYLLQRQDARRTMGISGREYVQERCTIERMIERIVAALDDSSWSAGRGRLLGRTIRDHSPTSVRTVQRIHNEERGNPSAGVNVVIRERLKETSEQSNPCGVCGEDRPERFRVYFDGHLKLYRCLTCGFVARYPGPGQTARMPNYEDCFTLDFLANAEFMHPERRLAFQDTLSRFEKVKPSGRLLDVGCGDGHLLYLAATRGFDCYGIDPSGTLCKYASAKSGANIIRGEYDGHVFPKEYFDVITLIHILEHFSEPATVLKTAWHHLVPGGVLVVEVPSIHSPHFLAYKVTGMQRFVERRITPGHLGHFSPKSLLTLTHRTGFAPISLVTGRCRYKYSGVMEQIAKVIDPVLDAFKVGALLYIGAKILR